MAGVAERLPRLLALVPYLLARPGVPIAEAAADLGVSERQLRRDLELLWMCGLPGYGPGDLIDLSFEGDTVTVTFDAGMRRPLRLSRAEATALVVALRALAEIPEVVDADAVRRALAKIEAAAGQADGVVVGLGTRMDATLSAVREALDLGRALRIRYYTASRDAVGERTVDPVRLLLVEGRNYLEAWCHLTEEIRLFRVDRIDETSLLDQPVRDRAAAGRRSAGRSAGRAEAATTAQLGGLFRAQPQQQVAVLILTPEARWIAEYYPVEDVVELDGGVAQVRMRYANLGWMVRLVLGLGADVAVREPADLAAAVTTRARAALHRYEVAEQELT